MGTSKDCPHSKTPSPLFMPFASGKLAEIELSFYVSPDKRDGTPIATYPLMNDVSPDLDRTVRYAAEVAYRLALESSGPADRSFSVGYSLKDMGGETRVVGKSGGLIMAIALYGRVVDLQFGRVAATGALTSLTDGGDVSAIDGLVAKLSGALAVLESGDVMFYPIVNDPEVSDLLKKEYVDRGIRLIGVATVREALSHLMGGTVAPGAELRQKRRPVQLFLVASVLLAGIALGLGSFLNENEPALAGRSSAVAPTLAAEKPLPTAKKATLAESRQVEQKESALPQKFSHGFE